MKNIKKITISFMVVVAIFAMGSCKKDPGAGGKKNLSGLVTYDDGSAAEGAIVSIAYDAAEATTEFDNTTVTSSDGSFKFEGLTKGDYFIDAEYTDALGYTFICDGATVLIDKKKGDLEVGTLVLE